MITEGALRLPLCQSEESWKSKEMGQISSRFFLMPSTQKTQFVSVDFSLFGLASTKRVSGVMTNFSLTHLCTFSVIQVTVVS